MRRHILQKWYYYNLKAMQSRPTPDPRMKSWDSLLHKPSLHRITYRINTSIELVNVPELLVALAKNTTAELLHK